MNRNDLLSSIREPGAVLLDGWSDQGRWTIALPEPLEEFRVAWGEEARLDAFLRARAVACGQEAAGPPPPTALPFAGGWVGFLSYEVGAQWEGASPRGKPPPEPAALFFRHASGWVIDPVGDAWRIGDSAAAPKLFEPAATIPPRGPESLTQSLSGERYEAAHASIREGIARGDFYQVNLTSRFVAAWDGRPDPRALYLRIAGEPPPPYAMLLRGGDFDIVGASPELFLRADLRSRKVEMRPIKGTAPRSLDPERDAQLARGLRDSPKDRAENVMIVDLCRNDLGRVCETGSVDVAELCALRSHRVHHLESTITGVLREGITPAEILRATFPPGSVTGAPKRAAVKAIRTLEPDARGVYTGAAGFFDDRGRMAFNVAIRTAVSTDREVRYHAGGGITWDSVASREREEIGWKAREFLGLFEKPAR